ncbi:hypothetical protein [Thaumasiovibrio subtropicus]|uniref:hypothetical protein n=2 Tax=Thaumasiovibrio subtropicus TaxID=1891207 RepID=UPI001C859F77|nr:hypothetical protein [Thaumasiovibrio subtropicus]
MLGESIISSIEANTNLVKIDNIENRIKQGLELCDSFLSRPHDICLRIDALHVEYMQSRNDKLLALDVAVKARKVFEEHDIAKHLYYIEAIEREAKILFDLNRYPESIEISTKAIDLFGVNGKVVSPCFYFMLSRSYEQVGESGKAKSILDDLRISNGDNDYSMQGCD